MDETRRNEIGATVFAVLTGLSALFFTGWLFTGGGCSDKGTDYVDGGDAETGDASDTEATETPDNEITFVDSSKLADANAEISKLKADLDAANAKLTADLDGATDINLDASADVEGLKADLEAMNLKTGDFDLKINQLTGNLDGAKTEIGTLKAKLSDLEGVKADLDASVKAKADLETKLAAAEKASGDWKIKFDAANTKAAADLKAKMDASAKAEADLKAQLDAAMKKSGNVEMATAEADKLRARITDLEKKLGDLGKEKMAMTASGGDALKALQGKFDALQKKADADAKALADSKKAMTANAGEAAKKLQAELDAAKKKAADDAKAAAEKIAAAEKQLADSQKAMAANAGDAAKKLEAELAAARKKLADDGKAWGTAKAKLNTTNAGLEKEIAALKKQLAAQKIAMAAAPQGARADGLPTLDLPLLVNDPAKLDPKFTDLFGKLKGIEDNSAAREKLYTELKADGKSDPALRVSFSSGSDYISSAQRTKIKNVIDQAPEGAKFLVVGYASKDGSKETNYRLSSQRASNVAKRIADQVGGDDKVQAVYFGDTSRFSSNLSPNRVVEVWRVK